MRSLAHRRLVGGLAHEGDGTGRGRRVEAGGGLSSESESKGLCSWFAPGGSCLVGGKAKAYLIDLPHAARELGLGEGARLGLCLLGRIPPSCFEQRLPNMEGERYRCALPLPLCTSAALKILACIHDGGGWGGFLRYLREGMKWAIPAHPDSTGLPSPSGFPPPARHPAPQSPGGSHLPCPLPPLRPPPPPPVANPSIPLSYSLLRARTPFHQPLSPTIRQLLLRLWSESNTRRPR